MRILSALPLALLCFAAVPTAAAAPDATLDAVSRPAATVAPTSSAAARELAALRGAEQLRAQAVASRDIPTMRKLISGDYYHVETSGRARTKTEFLQALARDEFEFRSYEVLDMEVRMLDSGRAAVVTGRFRASTRADMRAETQGAGRARELRGRYVRMWVLGPEGWRNTLQQSTEVRTPAQGQRPTAD
ncbi:nuclear transport factor 2 family protein [Telluria beijingensis]|uniref:nuclear transport factor 2 family protein n=1 Tax=Telluria beijingensis TaxID=3068633 RepID=UPI00279591B2|nr:nuclear transport factor 2 family protein [Massilia sp. REN29]